MKNGRTWHFSRTLLVKNNIQFSLVIYSCLLVLLTVVFTVAISSTKEMAADEVGVFGIPITKIVLCLIAMVVLVTAVIANLEMTNRFIGPLLRLREHMEQVANGQRSDEVHFREGDDFQDLAESYNRVVKRLMVSEKSSLPQPANHAALQEVKKSA